MTVRVVAPDVYDKKRHLGRLLLFLAGAFVLPLVAHSYIGLSSYYLADDYCIANEARRGIWASQLYWYMNWEGTISSNLLATLVGPAHLSIVRVWPVGVLVTWMVLLTWTVCQLKASTEYRHDWSTSTILAAMILGLTLDGQPRMTPQTLYWLDGSTKYLTPQLFLTGYVGFVVHCQNREGHQTNSRNRHIAAGVLAAIGGLFAEAHTSAQVTGLILATLACIFLASRTRRQQLLPPLIAGVGGSLIALLLLGLAPGMRVRQALLTEPPDLITLGVKTIGFTLEFLLEAATRAPDSLVLAIILPALLGWASNKHEPGQRYRREQGDSSTLPWLIGIPVGAFIIFLGCFATTTWAASSFPPVRTLLIPQFLLFTALTTWGYLSGRWISTRWIAARRDHIKIPLLVVLAVAAVWPLGRSQDIFSGRVEADASARTWKTFDQRLRLARQQGTSAVHLPAPENEAGLDVIGPDASFWVNSCVSDFYGVEVTGYPPPPVPAEADRQSIDSVTAQISDIATISSYSIPRFFAWPGETLPVSVHWLPHATTELPHSVSIDLFAEDGQVHTQITPLLPGNYDTTVWAPERPFVATYMLEIPEATKATSSAPIVISLHEFGARLPVITRGNTPGSALGEIRILESSCGPNLQELNSLGRTSDARLFEAVVKLLAGDPIVGRLEIEVGVFDSVVNLCDDQTSRPQREWAIELVTQNSDVSEVIDDMQ